LRSTLFLAAALLIVMTSFASGEEKAATSALPVALKMLGSDASIVLSKDTAHRIRGAGTTLTQNKVTLIMDGNSEGITSLLEGTFGGFNLATINGDMSTIISEGTIGALSGNINLNLGGLSFSFAGKAFQETINFAGKFEQTFEQSFGF
jgi:hypothetical protein